MIQEIDFTNNDVDLQSSVYSATLTFLLELIIDKITAMFKIILPILVSNSELSMPLVKRRRLLLFSMDLVQDCDHVQYVY